MKDGDQEQIQPQLPNLKAIFGEQANIIRNEDGRYIVDSVLKDATCHGGQKIHLELEEVKTPKNNIFIAKEFKIDDLSLNEEIKINYFFMIPERDFIKEGQESAEPNMIDHLMLLAGAKGFNDGRVRLTNLEDGDGLAALLHEMGHVLDKSPLSVTEFLDQGKILEYLNDLKNGKTFTNEDIENLRKNGENILDFEMFANMNALRFIDYFRKKGFDVFKDDEEMFRVKKFLFTITAYQFRKNPEFVELVGTQRINELLTL